MRDSVTPSPMLPAVQHYNAVFDWYLFPARMEGGKKYSYLSKKHAPEHLNWGMTANPELLKKNFSNPLWRNKCGIGLPTGVVNQLFVVEFDTIEGHGVDGAASLQRMEDEYGELPLTLMARSPSGSVHRFYNHPGTIFKIKSTDSVAGYAGVDVKGDGGMVVIPPSRRKDGEYEWLNDEEIANAPEWLLNLVVDDAPLTETVVINDPYLDVAHEQNPPAEIEEVEAALAAIPNDDVPWDEWNRIGMAIFSNSPNDEGLHAFDAWSRQSGKYNKRATASKWRAFFGSPPDSIHVSTLFYLANETDTDWRVDHKSPKTNGRDTSPPPVLDIDDAPIDLWNQFATPELPRDLLPVQIEEYAFEQGAVMGCDPAGLAMSALTICAAVIPDTIKLQVKRHDSNFLQAARLWTALVGDPSTLKSPIIYDAMRPVVRIENKLAEDYAAERRAFELLSKADQQLREEPTPKRLKLGDTTAEAVQDILKTNPEGLLLECDELSSFFGNMERYSNSRGGGSERGFWLTAYNGAPYTVDRVKRGSFRIKNLSISILGGVQPSKIREVADAVVDDGLIQRLTPIVLGEGVLGDDRPISPLAQQYDVLIENLYDWRMNCQGYGALAFSDDAQMICAEVLRRNHELTKLDVLGKLLVGHFGKYDGVFARLCVIWHCVENYQNFTSVISADTAQRVADFMHRFLRPHAMMFYAGVLDLADEHGRLQAVAGYILARELKELTVRDIQRGTRSMRKLARRDIENICDYLAAMYWLTKVAGRRASEAKWMVNPVVHRLFKTRASEEKIRRQVVSELLKEQFKGMNPKHRESGDNGDNAP
jgi:hypothetical protein